MIFINSNFFDTKFKLSLISDTNKKGGCEYDINLEQVLHSKFKKAEDIDLQVINNYMINFLGMYDHMLSSYISTHIELLSDFSDKISDVINNWENYN